MPLKASLIIAPSNINKDCAMENLTLETLPKAFTQIALEILEIKRLLQEQSQIIHNIETEQWFDLPELCSYHPDKPSKATVYAWVNEGLIPVHKSSKKLRFLKSEIDQWLKQGKRKSIYELNAEVVNRLNHKK